MDKQKGEKEKKQNNNYIQETFDWRLVCRPMLMSTDVASIMLPVSRGIMDRERDIDTAAGPLANAPGGPAAVRGMKRGDPEPDAQTAAALTDLPGAECKRPRIDGTGTVVGDIGQVGMKCKHTHTHFHGHLHHSGTALSIFSFFIFYLFISVFNEYQPLSFNPLTMKLLFLSISRDDDDGDDDVLIGFLSLSLSPPLSLINNIIMHHCSKG